MFFIGFVPMIDNNLSGGEVNISFSKKTFLSVILSVQGDNRMATEQQASTAQLLKIVHDQEYFTGHAAPPALDLDHAMDDREWIGVDLDGTLAHYDSWQGHEHIGIPIPLMMDRVRQWLAEGRRLKIFTARVSTADRMERQQCVAAIGNWLESHGLPRLEITCVKDYGMLELWDDRAVQVIKNTGRAPLGSTRGF
jgi:hypothetical protein